MEIVLQEWLEAQKKSASSITSTHYGTKETGSATVSALKAAEKKTKFGK